MSDRIAVALPDGRWLALSPEAFAEALAAGAHLLGAPAGSAAAAGDEPLFDADQLATVLQLPVTWIEQAAREGRIPSVQAGRWRRFRRSAVEAALSSHVKTPAGGRIPAGAIHHDLRTSIDDPNHESAYGRRNHNVRPRITPAG